jgi:hypothetical protein
VGVAAPAGPVEAALVTWWQALILLGMLVAAFMFFEKGY